MLQIFQKPILFTAKRKALTREYIKIHYGMLTDSIIIQPRMIVIHWTEIDTFRKSFEAFYPEKLPKKRKHLLGSKSKLNVSAHFLINKNGKAFQLMPDNWMARHCVGLNSFAIGIENFGGENNRQNLTTNQLLTNIELISYLSQKYDTIEYIIGHYEYFHFIEHPLFLEKDNSYFTDKVDPGKVFMDSIKMKLKLRKELLFI